MKRQVDGTVRSWEHMNQSAISHRNVTKIRKFAIAISVLLALLVLGFVFVVAVSARMESDLRSEIKASKTPTSIGAFLNSPRLRQSIGKIVFFSDVRLQQGPSKRVFFARGHAGASLVVVWDSSMPDVPHHGMIADVMGVVTSSPSIQSMVKEWKLNRQQAEQAHDDSVYITATMVKPAS
jgi:hypothetical protein